MLGVSKRLLLVSSGVVGLAVMGIALALILATRGDGPGTGPVGPRSTFLTASRSSDIAILELATGRIRLATRRKGPYVAVASPTWSPNGRRLAFAQQSCPQCPFRIAVAGTAGAPSTLISGRRKDLNEPSWSPDGDRIALTTSEHAERTLAVLDIPAGRIKSLEPAKEEGDDEEEEVESPNHPSFSPDGRSVAFDAETARERTSIHLLDVETGELRAVESDADHYASPTYSPSGRRLAFARTDAAYTWDVCVAKLDGREQDCLTRGAANDTEPSWSPDGRSIVFASDRGNPKLGLRSLYLVNIDGSDLRRLTSAFDDGAPAFSPDGTEVAFVRRRVVKVRR